MHRSKLVIRTLTTLKACSVHAPRFDLIARTRDDTFKQMVHAPYGFNTEQNAFSVKPIMGDGKEIYFAVRRCTTSVNIFLLTDRVTVVTDRDTFGSAPMRHLARNSLIPGTLELAESFGVDSDQLLREVGLDREMARGIGTLVPSEAIIDTVELAAIKSGRNDFGLLLGTRQDHRSIGPLGLLFEQATSITELQSFSQRFFHLHNTALRYTLSRANGRGSLELQIRAKGVFEPRQYVECLFVICIRMARIILGQKWRPVAVSFKHHRLAERRAYERQFGVVPQFDQDTNAILCNAKELDQRIEPRDPALKLRLEAMLQELDSAFGSDLAAKVSHVTRALLPAGQASIANVAKVMSLGSRTLQRKLRARQLSFTDILIDTRLELARKHLGEDGLTVTQVAPILGFSEASAVSRFLREHGGRSGRKSHKR